MKPENLKDLTLEAEALFTQIYESENETALLEILDLLRSKVDATAYIYDAFDVEVATLKARREAVLDKIDRQILRMENAQKAISNRLIFWHKQGLISDKLMGDERQIILRNYPVVEVNIEPEKLPEQFRTEKVTFSPKKDAIKKALKEGDESLGVMCELKDNFKPQFGYRANLKAKK